MRRATAGSMFAVFLAGLLSCEKDRGAFLPSFAFEVKRMSVSIALPEPWDLILVIDDSPAMRPFQSALEESLAHLRESTIAALSAPCAPVRIGVLTTSSEGRLSDQVGTLTFENNEPVVQKQSEPACRVIGPDNMDCLYDPVAHAGVGLVGFEGSAYPRPLYSLRRFLESPEALGFLRPEAMLAVLIVSPGEDCGDPGEVAEGLDGMDGRICSYAAKGVGPDGSSSHPADPGHCPYRLTPVSALHDQLVLAKGGQEGRVRAAAVVGVGEGGTAIIEFEGSDPSAPVRPACSLEACLGEDCGALPGTRAIALTSSFGGNGFRGSICRQDWFENDIIDLGSVTPIACPRVFKLEAKVLDPALVSVLIEGEPVPRYTCEAEPGLVACAGPDDSSCRCVESYRLAPPSVPPDPQAPGGVLEVAFDPCALCDPEDGLVTLEIVYAVRG